MKKSVGAVITYAVILTILLIFGISFFDKVWEFPGNFEFFKTFPSADLPLGSIPLMVIALLGTGIFISFKLKFPQLRYIWHGIKVTAGKYDNPEDKGDLKHFNALTTALSATVGIGNIAGVATALYYGGPGAMFWMWVTAFFGTALKYSECTLALKYREFDPDGHTAGGPMYTIEKGLGPNWRWLAVTFASFAVICSFATGNAIQAFTASDQFYSEIVQVLGPHHPLTEKWALVGSFQVSWQQIINGLALVLIIGAVILGGIKRIGSVTGILAPFMAALYVISAMLIIFSNLHLLQDSFGKIFTMAFNPPAQISGIGGGTFLIFLNTMMWGIKRGLYSNEAGQGSAPIAHSAAKTEYAVREGVVALLEPIIDTLIICTMTGLVIISTGAWHHTQFYVERIDPNFTGELMNSSILTAFAFKEGLSWLFPYGDKIVTLCVALFAISTAISWSYYGDRAADYLFGPKAIQLYKYLFLIFVFIGSIAELEAVWGFGDAALGFMTFPNLLSIVLLSGTLKKMTKGYFAIDHPEYGKNKKK